ncbi:MAG TPA: ion channel [Polyangia bacterium]|nr:ion channel [Polyangia bacterium]
MSVEPPAKPPVKPPFRPRGDGTDVTRVGLDRRPFGDLYHAMLKARWTSLLGLLVIAYVIINSLFAVGYLLEPGSVENARPGSFYDAFFFSIQTMATIGYGKMSPASTLAHVLVSIEALIGLLGFAMATGLIFAKFSRPTARVLFSRVAIMSPRDGVPSLVFRMGNERANQVVEAQLNLAMVRNEVTVEGERIRRIYDLKLARGRTAVFTLSWTAYHPITPDSPLFGATPETLQASETAIVASFTGIDDTFSQTVHARHTYTYDEIVWSGKFADIMKRTDAGERIIDYSKFHDVVPS